jgi:hypothetical protein
MKPRSHETFTQKVFSRRNRVIGALTFAIAGSVFAVEEGWKAYDAHDPKWFEQINDLTFVRRFHSLPTMGAVDGLHMPWSDDYYASSKGGIAYRYATGESPFSYKTYSKQEILRMSSDQLAQLSAAEKFDIARGKYDFPTVARERRRTSPNADHWEGICHGWTAAATNHAEPKPVTVTNPDGLQVPLNSSDVKAMLSWYYGEEMWRQRSSIQVGTRCQGEEGERRRGILGRLGLRGPRNACKSVNPGSLHLVLANQLGLANRPFIADVDRKKEVWNQPVIGFRSQVLGDYPLSNTADPTAVSAKEVRTTMDYVAELPPQRDPHVPKKTNRVMSVHYHYSIELDRDGNIVGGEWLDTDPTNQKSRPDFIWQVKPLRFVGDYSILDPAHPKAIYVPITSEDLRNVPQPVASPPEVFPEPESTSDSYPATEDSQEPAHE